MVDETEIERRKGLTFLQAEGVVPLPLQLVDGDIGKEFRNRIWTIFWASLTTALKIGYDKYLFKDAEFGGACLDEWIDRRHQRIDRFPLIEKLNVRKLLDYHEDLILNTTKLQFIDYMQWVLRDNRYPEKMRSGIEKTFDEFSGPYVVVANPPTIVPLDVADDQAIVEQALKEVSGSYAKGARRHLIDASKALSDGQFREAIRDSIHAVESAAKFLAADDGADLGKALRLLEQKHELHPALKVAFEKLYAYSSDEKGIRHALVDEENAKVTRDEAVFMFGACSIFVSYLMRKLLKESNTAEAH